MAYVTLERMGVEPESIHKLGLHVMPVDGIGDRITLYEETMKWYRVGGRGYTPAWSLDGKRIAFVLGVQLFLMDVQDAIQGKGDPHITYLAEGEHPAWSPDGRYIAFDALQGGNRDIYIVLVPPAGENSDGE